VEAGDPATATDVRVVEEATRPPRPYTDATLLGAMETAGKTLDDAALKRALRNAGLGTPATRAAILETLLARKYVERRGKDLRATDRGSALIDAVPLDELKSAELTGRWEARLAAIAEGRDARDAFMRDVGEHVREVVEAIRVAPPPPAEVSDQSPGAVLGACPVCGTPVRETPATYSCETGRSCAFVVFKTMSTRAISARMVRQLLKEGRTDVVKGFKSKAGKPFEAALEWRDGKVQFAFPPREEARPATPEVPREEARPATPEGLPCPACKEGRLVRGRAAWGCGRWREGCRWVLPFEVDGRVLSAAEAVARVVGKGADDNRPTDRR
jgi:DNA topoisomerase III